MLIQFAVQVMKQTPPPSAILYANPITLVMYGKVSSMIWALVTLLDAIFDGQEV